MHLGHLIHQADNYRGSFLGTGWELRTDAYGAIRAGKGVLLTYCDARCKSLPVLISSAPPTDDVVLDDKQCADHAQIESHAMRVDICEFGLMHQGLESSPVIAAWLQTPVTPESFDDLRERWLAANSYT